MNFEKSMDRIHDQLEEVYESYIFVGKGKGTKKGCVAIHGSDEDLLTHLHKAYFDVREEIVKKYNGDEELADKLMKTVYKTPEQLHEIVMEELHNLFRKAFEDVNAEDEEDEDDDAEDESCDCDDDTQEDDSCGCVGHETTEEKAHRKAVEALRKAVRDCSDDDLTFDLSGHVRRGKPRN